MACPGKYNSCSVLRVTHGFYFADWLFLYYVAKNLDNYVFKELLKHMAHDMEDRRDVHHQSSSTIINEEYPLKQRKNGAKDVVWLLLHKTIVIAIRLIHLIIVINLQDSIDRSFELFISLITGHSIKI